VTAPATLTPSRGTGATRSLPDIADPGAVFSTSYAQARRRFRDAAARRDLVVESSVLDLPGVDGEELAVDVVRDGPADAARLLIVLSGVHGVEGYCGSAVQTGLLELGEPAQLLGAKAHDTAALYIHALNPYGFSHSRRVTQENVDLNRNCIDFDVPLPVNAGYAEIHDLLLPTTWPPASADDAALAAYATRVGARACSAQSRSASTPMRMDVLRRPRADLEQPRAARDSSPPRSPVPADRVHRHPHRPGALRPRRTHLRVA
jgi:hypothetical protein